MSMETGPSSLFHEGDNQALHQTLEPGIRTLLNCEESTIIHSIKSLWVFCMLQRVVHLIWNFTPTFLKKHKICFDSHLLFSEILSGNTATKTI